MSQVNDDSIMIESQVSRVDSQVSQVNDVPIPVVPNKRGRKPKLKVIHDDNQNDILIALIGRPPAIGKALELDYYALVLLNSMPT